MKTEDTLSNPTKLIILMDSILFTGFIAAALLFIKIPPLNVCAALFGALSAAIMIKFFAAGAGGVVGARLMKIKKLSDYLASVVISLLISLIFAGSVYDYLHPKYAWLHDYAVYGGLAMFGIPIVLILFSFLKRTNERSDDIADAGADIIVKNLRGNVIVKKLRGKNAEDGEAK